MSNYYVGLISGTSMDGIDAVVARFDDRSIEIAATHCEAYSPDLRRDLKAAIKLPLDVDPDPGRNLHRRVGEAFRDAAMAVIERSGIPRTSINAIGSHGQTLRHQPNAAEPFSLQIGDADIIAQALGIATIADFRSADITVGGQGAPLVPPFHHWLFGQASESCVVVNIGGISNITLLTQDASTVVGYDTGPGNGLMDAWIAEQQGQAYDNDGAWASQGEIDAALLAAMLADPYFSLAAPKSTGFEYFNLEWLRNFPVDSITAGDVQTTLCELTAATISSEIEKNSASPENIFVCGGGAHNSELMRRLARYNPDSRVSSTAAAGLDPDWVEAAAFAWLAMRKLQNLPGNLPSVTGASQSVTLGELHSP